MIELNFVSSYSIDVVNYKTTGEVAIKKGGPMHFFEKQLQNFKDKIKINVLESGFCLVEIDRFENEEFGKIVYTKNVKTQSSSIKVKNLVVSFVKDEIDVNHISNYETENLFLDLQGYYRIFRDIGQKVNKGNLPQFQKLVVKATQKEVKVLDEAFKDEIVKNHILLFTRGAKGVRVFEKGKKYDIFPSEILKVQDTIGAGDVFFVNFVVSYLELKNTILAVRDGILKVDEFLQKGNVNFANNC